MPDRGHLHRIHTLDSIVEELTFVVTPLLGTAAMALIDPRRVIAAGALLLLPAVLGVLAILRALRAVQDDGGSSSDQVYPRRPVARAARMRSSTLARSR
ncbi:hypothetical protein BZZ08_00655 [Streptomyces sp. MH60]|nr:hypothetical protein BZZ08_00655 [Streptomyces sp. MH60]